MQIKNIQVNNFGKLQNKKLELKSGINVIYGENESGKSTLLDFITSMFYGINKNKNGKEITNYDKYMPWSEGEFSGKIAYELDNGENFEVYRNFTKRQPQIFDKNARDISKEFTIDKNYGNKFFYEQTKVDEELFNMSMVIHQQEVRLDNKSQNTLIQKASNIMLTGEDNASYQKIVGKLNKRHLEEIGTLKSPTKPLYLASKNVEELQIKRSELEILNPIKNEIQEDINRKEKEIKNEEEMLKILQELDNVSREARLEEEKIEIYEKAKEELAGQKKLFEASLSRIEPSEKQKGYTNLLYNIPGILFVISVALIFVLDSKIIGEAGALVSIIMFLVILINNLKKASKLKKEEKEKNKQKAELENKIELVESEIEAKEKLIKENKESLELSTKMKKEQIRLKYPKVGQFVFDSNINILEEQNYINSLKLNLSKKELEIKQISEKLENLVEIQEKLNSNKELYDELIEYDEVINIAKEALDTAYLEMRESITPQFTENLSKSIEKITDGKYKQIKVNDENGLSLETQNGNYITANHLSQGTIDQIYLSLRISSINELTEENMIIILDETFAYFDDHRLKCVLEFLGENYSDKQIIILTCTDREIKALEQIGTNYNRIML